MAVELKEMLDVIKTTLNLDEISPDRTDDIVKVIHLQRVETNIDGL